MKRVLEIAIVITGVTQDCLLEKKQNHNRSFSGKSQPCCFVIKNHRNHHTSTIPFCLLRKALSSLHYFFPLLCSSHLRSRQFSRDLLGDFLPGMTLNLSRLYCGYANPVQRLDGDCSAAYKTSVTRNNSRWQDGVCNT